MWFAVLFGLHDTDGTDEGQSECNHLQLGRRCDVLDALHHAVSSDCQLSLEGNREFLTKVQLWWIIHIRLSFLFNSSSLNSRKPASQSIRQKIIVELAQMLPS